ncbi:LysR family transcriptional regulator substrate-binding protein [Corynebacterium ammoniagenes]|uniref:LysR family transcriptional regulator substrate-binding protein n=1 Tax=Corynebacterium ammoniagenes TaxID=1697 RepID=UPI001459B260|nr:LysR family transcriptional regulator substrate-binding protein [Corynebacterium ammoniagenes]NMF31326.1 LysR family transcriptional regulator substrate-binding protein [Corynebacterium ammoniagenes]
MLRLTFATGTEPGKWFERYRRATDHGGLETIDADDAIAVVLAGDADVALARLPHGGIDKRISEDDTHIVRLYTESRGVAVPKDSVFAELGEAVDPRDIADEHLNYRIADDASLNIDEIRAGLQVVAANVGIVIAPRPLLKVLSKKQVVPLELKDPSVPSTDIALVWPKEKDSVAIQDFVGIAKGRTQNSSRHEAPKKSASEKTKAKQARRNDAQGRARGLAQGRTQKNSGRKGSLGRGSSPRRGRRG